MRGALAAVSVMGAFTSSCVGRPATRSRPTKKARRNALPSLLQCRPCRQPDAAGSADAVAGLAEDRAAALGRRNRLERQNLGLHPGIARNRQIGIACNHTSVLVGSHAQSPLKRCPLVAAVANTSRKADQ